MPLSSPLEPCPACELDAVARSRVRSAGAPIEALACSACGEWWFESNGVRLTLNAIRNLGRVHGVRRRD